MTINRVLTIKNLTQKQQGIVYESTEDEGAAEYHAELQSVIDSITMTSTDKEILDAAEWVGESSSIIYDEVKNYE